MPKIKCKQATSESKRPFKYRRFYSPKSYDKDSIRYGFAECNQTKLSRARCIFCNLTYSNSSMLRDRMEGHLRKLHSEFKDKDIDFFRWYSSKNVGNEPKTYVWNHSRIVHLIEIYKNKRALWEASALGGKHPKLARREHADLGILMNMNTHVAEEKMKSLVERFKSELRKGKNVFGEYISKWPFFNDLLFLCGEDEEGHSNFDAFMNSNYRVIQRENNDLMRQLKTPNLNQNVDKVQVDSSLQTRPPETAGQNCLEASNSSDEFLEYDQLKDPTFQGIECQVYSKYVSLKIQKATGIQRTLLEKLIGDVLFLARADQLTESHSIQCNYNTDLVLNVKKQ